MVTSTILKKIVELMKLALHHRDVTTMNLQIWWYRTNCPMIKSAPTTNEHFNNKYAKLW